MRNLIFMMVGALILSLMLAGCGGKKSGELEGAKLAIAAETPEVLKLGAVLEPEEKAKKRGGYLVPQSYVDGMNKFGYDSAKIIIYEKLGQNVFYSPVSFYMALSVLESGAAGDTAAEIRKALNMDSHSELARLGHNFINRITIEEENSILKLANSVWTDTKSGQMQFKNEFLEVASNNYYASIYSAKFGSSQTDEMMSRWTEQNTAGKLKPKFKSDPDNVMSIINTIYLKDDWLREFYKEDTEKGDFTLADGTKVGVDFMSQKKKGDYFEGDDYSVFVKPLYNNEAVFILPKEGVTTIDLLARYGLEDLVPEKMEGRMADLKLPKLNIESKIDLKMVLTGMGMGSVMSDSANFSRISDIPLKVSSAIQETVMIANEDGIEAAAYTKMDMECTAMPDIEEPVQMWLDRPFIMIVRNNLGANLFIGVVENPSIK